MKYDEFAFFNQQLAAMLRDGIPLEGALCRLCEEMDAGSLRTELQALETDLGQGKPMAEALKPRQLPELYKRMVLVGVKGGDLPGALTMLADYFQRQSNMWIRLKGLMVYPLIILIVAFGVSLLFSFLSMHLIVPSIFGIFGGQLPRQVPFPLMENFWIFPTVFAFLILLTIVFMLVPKFRNTMRWRLPAFKEASISRVAASLNMLLKNGVPLPEAIGLIGDLETNEEAVADLNLWRQMIGAGAKKFSEVAKRSRLFPPTFVWMVTNAGEDLGAGFRRASEIYQARAIYRTEVAMHAVLPATVLCLGGLILFEAFILLSFFMAFVNVDTVI